MLSPGAKPSKVRDFVFCTSRSHILDDDDDDDDDDYNVNHLPNYCIAYRFEQTPSTLTTIDVQCYVDRWGCQCNNPYNARFFVFASRVRVCFLPPP